MPRLLRFLLFSAGLLALALFGGAAPAVFAATETVTTAGSVTVTANVLNVRAGPGTTYNILDRVSEGMTLPVLDQDASGGWLQVEVPGGLVGWVSAEFVSQADGPADFTLPVRIVAAAIGLDSRIVPAGWHTVQNADGSTGAEWDVPAYAAGWLITSARPGTTGNAVLAGHHNIEGEVFRYVVDLNPGDAITLYTGEATLHYRVTDRFILPDKYVSYQQRLANAQWIGPFGDERLTLVTCWPYTNNTHRVIVIAKPDK
ncbi:MAG TPA: sortase [Anaerolineae bacterium]